MTSYTEPQIINKLKAQKIAFRANARKYGVRFLSQITYTARDQTHLARPKATVAGLAVINGHTELKYPSASSEDTTSWLTVDLYKIAPILGG